MLIAKLTNYFILYFQRILRFENITGYPYYLVIDPSNVCQLKCPFCDGHLRPQVIMRFSDFKNIIDSIGRTCINLELYNWGEPFLNKQIIEMINYANQKYNIYTRISSNLNLCNDEFYEALVLSRLNSLTISLDGASQETYEKYRRNGSFSRVTDNIRLIVKYKKQYRKMEPKLVWQFLVFGHNQHEIEKAKQMARELSVNEIIFQKPNIPREHLNWSSTITKFSSSGDSRINHSNNSLGDKICNWPFSSIAINANGSVSACCAVAREEDDFGNIFARDFSKIWNNDDFRCARKCVLENRVEKDSSNICGRCEMKGLINFAPNFLELLYYTIKPLRVLWMKSNKFRITNC